MVLPPYNLLLQGEFPPEIAFVILVFCLFVGFLWIIPGNKVCIIILIILIDCLNIYYSVAAKK